MIGQKMIQDLLTRSSLPHFIVLVGANGSGRLMVIRECLSSSFDIFYISEVTADAIRDTIDVAKKNAGVRSLYVFHHADTMSTNAKNAMLKLLEEPPKDAYFIMTLEDVNNTIPTILSRAIVYSMDAYTERELSEYALVKYGVKNKLLEEICTNPGEIDVLVNRIDDFYGYVKKVVDNIDVVSGSNSFKIGLRLALDSSDSDDKYDLSLFWHGFSYECMRRVIDNLGKANQKYVRGVIITSTYIQSLRINGVNKLMAFDNWLLSIRSEWFKYADN